jgi:hypothetical protein
MILTNLRCCGIYLFVYDTVMLYKLLSIISSRSLFVEITSYINIIVNKAKL